MTAPQAAPPPERLPGGEERAGSITLTATVASGRRSTALLGHRDGEAEPVVVRRPTSNPARFLADCEEAGGLRAGGGGATEDGTPSMPAVIGESLATVLASLFEKNEPLPIHLALTVAMGIADELLKLGKGAVHGDLVPHHVLIGYDGEVTVIDPAASAHLERAQSPGREGYRSPEHVDGEELKPASDIYVFGILLFEMTTGHPLFAESAHADNDARIKAGDMPKPRTLVGDGFPIELQLVLRKMLRPQTSGRFADARAAKDALRLAATSRADVGTHALAAWLRERFPERYDAWEALLEATRARTAPMPVAPSPDALETPPPSRAPTALEVPPRSFSLSGIAAESTVPTRPIPRGQTAPLSPPEEAESPLEVDTFQDLGSSTTGPLTMEDIERADAEERQLFSFPAADDEPASRSRKRGAGPSLAPGLIPDLPTEVSTRRTPPLNPDAEHDPSVDPTALDEIVESDLMSGSLEALTLEPLPNLEIDDDSGSGPAWQPPFELEEPEATATGDAPGSPPPDVAFEEPGPSTGPSPAPFAASDLADGASDDLDADDEAFAPLDADFLDSLADSAPAPLSSADFLDALARPEDADDLEASPNTDRQGAAETLRLDEDAPDTFPPDHGLPAPPPPPAKKGGLPAPTPKSGGLPAPTPAKRPQEPREGAVPHDFADAAPSALALEDELSADLRLESPSGESLDSRDLTSDLWDEDPEDPDEPNDTIDESAAEDLLTPDELALVQRAAEIVPGRDDTVPLPVSPFRAATDPNPNAATAPLRGATDPSGPPAALPAAGDERPIAKGGSAQLPQHKPRPKPDDMSVRPVAPLMTPVESDKPNQRGIATQVVRDRVTDEHGAAIPTADFAAENQVPTQVTRERSRSKPPQDRRPPVDRDLTPVRAGPTLVDPLIPEDSHNSELVIPLSDDEIHRSERKRRVTIAALIIAPVTVLGLAFFAFSQLTQSPTAVSIPSQTDEGAPTRVEAGARVDPPAPPGGADPEPPPPTNPAPTKPPPVEAAPPPPVAPPPVDKPIEPPPPVEVDRAPPVEPPPVEAPPPPVEAPPPPVEAPPKLVTVRILPPHAKFEVDGVAYENNSQLEIGADPLEIRAFAEGYRSQRQTIAAGEQRNVTVMLKKNPPTEPAEPDSVDLEAP